MKALKALPNILTSSRIVGALALLLVEPLRTAFFVIYALCGLTDVLDGAIARAAKCSSQLGARLDSIADLVFYGVLAVCIHEQMWAALPLWIWVWIGGVIVLRLIAYLTAAGKYHRFAAMHTYLNKATGFVVFCIPFFLCAAWFPWYGVLGCAVATLSSVEELAIHLTSKTYCAGRKSIFLPPVPNKTA